MATTYDADGIAASLLYPADVTQGYIYNPVPSKVGLYGMIPAAATVTQFVNRGRNTGAGPAYVYWVSPDAADPTGTYYSGFVPFGQLADFVVVGSYLG